METVAKKKPPRRRLFTPEFKSEIVEACNHGDRSIWQVARDFDLTETAVREWVTQADVDAGRRDGLSSAEREEAVPAPTREPPAAGGHRHPAAGNGFLRKGGPDPV